MSVSFAPCPACDRHVKQGDGGCPFCGAAIALAAPPARSPLRLSRSALFALGAVGAAIATVDCGSAVALYGAPVPAVDGGSDAADGSVQPLYGGMPAPDAGAGLPDVTTVALYGATPPPDEP